MPSPSSDGLDAARQRIRAVYDPAEFQRLATIWRDELSRHFQYLATGTAPVLNWRPPADNVCRAASWLQSAPGDDLAARFAQLVREILASGQNLHHPRYLGHQVPASVPAAALFDAIGAATNQVMAIYEMGPWATVAERAMVECLGREIGYPAGQFSGICTHGASLANLTALLTARNVCLNRAWEGGISSRNQENPPVVIVQQDAHYSVVRAAGILGIGTENVLSVPVDERRKMHVGHLEERLESCRRRGQAVIAVVAGSCATPIGAFDPLEPIADVCQRYEVWLHVDAAHGGASLLSDRHRHLLTGIERADSVVWDAHKMMFMPALCAFLFYRQAAHQFDAFRQDAPYLFDPTNPGMAEFDSGTRTLECTKRAAALGVWGTWSLLGRQLFADLVDATYDMTRQFHGKLLLAPDFEPLHEPECNIQVFRWRPTEMEDWTDQQIGDFQLQLRREVITSGDAYLVPIRLNGQGALRVTIINPTTTALDLDDVLAILRQHGRRLIGRMGP